MRLIAGVILAGLAFADPGIVLGQTLSGQDNFTFRRIKVPGAGATTGHRITVQIDPAEQARRLAVAPKVPPVAKVDPAAVATDVALPATPTPSSYAWFWETVPTAKDAVSGRFPLAMAMLSQGPGGKSVSAPRMQHLQEIAQTYGTDILKATLGTEVSPALVLAVIGIESAGKVNAVSSAGAQGLMQLIPDTAARFGVTDSTNAGQNIKGGVAYLDWLMKEFDRDPLMVLAAYNAGEGAVKANSGVPPYAETRDYVPKVLAAWQVAQGLCQTPPELVTDPCVFKIIASGG
ncbi:MAG: lytic transglycosylase domain-containing protein [Paracoccaceae bacterium]